MGTTLVRLVRRAVIRLIGEYRGVLSSWTTPVATKQGQAKESSAVVRLWTWSGVK